MSAKIATQAPPLPNCLLVMMIDFLRVRQKRLVSGIFALLGSRRGSIHIFIGTFISSFYSAMTFLQIFCDYKWYFIKYHQAVQNASQRKSSTLGKEKALRGVFFVKPPTKSCFLEQNPKQEVGSSFIF